MKTKEDNIIAVKSYDFAVRCVKLYKYLCDQKHDYTIGKQLMRSGTSIGANLAEAQYGISKKDFLSKAYVSLKETAETMYWLEVLYRAGHLTDEQFNSMFNDCEELKKLFMSITKTTKNSLTPNS